MEKEITEQLSRFNLAPGYPYATAGELYLAVRKSLSDDRKRKRDQEKANRPPREEVREQLSAAARHEAQADAFRRNGNAPKAEAAVKKAAACVEKAGAAFQRCSEQDVAQFTPEEKQAIQARRPPAFPHVSNPADEKLSAAAAKDLYICDMRKMEVLARRQNARIAAQEKFLRQLLEQLKQVVSKVDPADANGVASALSLVKTAMVDPLEQFLAAGQGNQGGDEQHSSSSSSLR